MRREPGQFLSFPETIQLLIVHLSSYRKTDWSFPSPKVTGKFKSSHISSRQVYNVLNKHLIEAGVESRPFHALKATCYKICKGANWTPRIAAELLGDSLIVTKTHYGASSVGEMKKTAKDNLYSEGFQIIEE
jgi:integrase